MPEGFPQAEQNPKQEGIAVAGALHEDHKTPPEDGSFEPTLEPTQGRVEASDATLVGIADIAHLKIPADQQAENKGDVRRTRWFTAIVVGIGMAILAASPAAAVPPPDAPGQYWFTSWDISNIWQGGAQGQGITVAVLDSGVNANRPELSGRVVAGTDMTGRGGDGRTDSDRPRAHGTAMAILIAGQGGPSGLVGVAPESRILPVVVLGGGRSGTDAIADGIRYAVDNGAQVVNLSASTPGNSYPNNCPQNVQDAVRYAVKKGAVVVAAAGNGGETSNSPEYPATCVGTVAVGAINGGKHVWPKSQRQPYVDVAAPGVSIPSIDAAGEAGSSDGTSDAAALVSGAVALVWSKFPELTNRQIVARLLETVTDDADTPGKDNATGYGVIRPDDAINTPVPNDAPNPIFDELDELTSSTAPAASPADRPGLKATPERGIDFSRVAIVGGVTVAIVALLAAVITRRRGRGPTPPSK